MPSAPSFEQVLEAQKARYKSGDHPLAQRPSPQQLPEEPDAAGLEALLGSQLLEQAESDPESFERRGFEMIRKSMDGPARVAKAAECKAEANEQFAAKAWVASVSGFLAGIWFLQRGEPPCPSIVANAKLASFEDIPAALGFGEPCENEPTSTLTKEEAASASALRVTLHLNLAAAALKLSQWVVARTACEFVLMVDGRAASPKARYRLAKALEGQGELQEAIAVLERLLELDADNADARAFVEALHTRVAAASPAVPDESAETKRREAAEREHGSLETMTADGWAKLSPEEQQSMLEEINRGLDEEEETGAEFDTAALAAAMGRVGAIGRA